MLGYEGLYQVSNHGRVKSLARSKQNGHYVFPERILCPSMGNRYLHVCLCKDGRRKNGKIHKMVAAAFLGESPLTVNHRNGIRTDNRLDNLELLTVTDNIRHAFEIGLRNQRGERNRRAKITADCVIEIRRRLAAGEMGTRIARSLGITKNMVTKINTRRSWSHV